MLHENNKTRTRRVWKGKNKEVVEGRRATLRGWRQLGGEWPAGATGSTTVRALATATEATM